LALRKVPDLELQIVRDLANRLQPVPDPVAAAIEAGTGDLRDVVELDPSWQSAARPSGSPALAR
jgi:hypothetical protein